MRPKLHIRNNSLGVLTSPIEFTINRDLIRQWWKDPSPQNQQNIAWYTNTYSLVERRAFKEKWLSDMERFKTEIKFFRWFKISGQLGSTNDSLKTLVTRWYTKEQVVDSITPPLEGLKIPYRKEILTATPFKKSSDKDSSSIATLGDVNKILEQNNYSNQILHVISKQIEETSSGLGKTSSLVDKPNSSNTSPQIETYPIFKVPEFSRENYPKLSPEFSKSSALLERINEELTKLNISRGDKLSTLLSQANRHPHTKNFYSRPSFPDAFSSKKIICTFRVVLMALVSLNGI